MMLMLVSSSLAVVDWEDESTPLKAGMTLVFRVRSQVTFKDKAPTACHSDCDDLCATSSSG